MGTECHVTRKNIRVSSLEARTREHTILALIHPVVVSFLGCRLPVSAPEPLAAEHRPCLYRRDVHERVYTPQSALPIPVHGIAGLTSVDCPGVDICARDRDRTDIHSLENRGPSHGVSFHSFS